MKRFGVNCASLLRETQPRQDDRVLLSRRFQDVVTKQAFARSTTLIDPSLYGHFLRKQDVRRAADFQPKPV